ncbi:hypothetical protein SASPL_148943 [Salvia splendens]|uniref:Wall-associated receptor kinase galacturonan-binding domain-containing protein n=1 Tax=Salvia splendens TaxID=180675 RepID=A0A8X8WAU7_SALSN|nr:hypothetical protein SASPL_148943 [Salvia splendens]
MTTTHNFIFLITSSLLILSLHAASDASCSHSACGDIRNISYPFRVQGDPSHCGRSKYHELTCENNVTFVYLNSIKYYVKHINYDSSTIRLVDASINTDSTKCSFPKTSSKFYKFTDRSSSPYYIPDPSDKLLPVNLITCPNPVPNSSHFTDITACTLSHTRFRYVYVGHILASEVPHLCTLDLLVFTSWLVFWDFTNASLIQKSLLYGFELRFCDDCNGKSTKWGKLIHHLSGPKSYFLIPLAILGVSLLVTIIIGIAGVLVLSFTPTSLLENIQFSNYNNQTMLEAINHIVFIVSYKADVYSFGMLLMEMLRLNKDLTRNDDESSKYFPNWIYDHLNQGKDIDIGYVNENDDRNIGRKITIVALWCIQMSPDNRPSMNKVLEMLEGDVEHIQIPNYLSFMAGNEEESRATDSNASISLLHDNNIIEIISNA